MSSPARAPARLPRRALHGVLLIDKPVGLTSNDALQRARRLLRAEKAGHTGTLDPLASGLLPLCFGAATKFSQAGLDSDKAYRARLRLGVTRRGGDLEGEVLLERPVEVDEARLTAAIARFIGPQEQLPPMHSALKHEGRALYEYARQGIEIERQPRQVQVHRLELLGREGDEIELEARVSKGTYIRTLAEDLGEALGCGAHLAGLRRIACGALSIEAAISLEALEALDEAGRVACLLPADTLLADAPAVRLGAEDAGRFLSGMRRRLSLADAPVVRVYGPALQAGDEAPEAFLGSAHVKAGELISTRLLSPQEVQGLLVTS